MRRYTLATPLVLAVLAAPPALAPAALAPAALAQTQGAPSSVRPKAVPGTTGITQVPGAADSDTGGDRGSGTESGARSVSPSAKPSGGTGPLQGGGGPNGQGSATPEARSDATPSQRSGQPLRFAQAQRGTAQQESGPQVAPAQTDARVQRELQGLYTRLRITPAEQPQWNAFASTMQANAQQMSQLWSARQGGNTSALDDMRGYAQIAQAHAEGMQRLVAAFEPLYESLSPEQKAAADQAFRDAARSNGRRVGR